jgi:hypothetical protein
VCLIIDANYAPKVFRDVCCEDAVPIKRWLFEPSKNGKLALGGLVTRELEASGINRRTLGELGRAGRTVVIPDRDVEVETARIRRNIALQSDDPHIIALARLSGARTLCSLDTALGKDFTNPRVLGSPRGRIYKDSDHKALLCHTKSCGYRR